MTGDERSDPFSDVINLVAAPLAGTIRSFDQFRKGVDEFLRGVENFNRTMENLNQTAERINVLLAEVEEPIKAAMPQVTRTVKLADEMMQAVSGPAMAVAPGLNKLADALSTPGFAQLPNQLSQFTDVMTEMSKRLGPLTQFAESAGGLFGGLRLPGMGAPTRPAPSTAGSHDLVARGRTVTHEPPTPAAALDEQPSVETVVDRSTPVATTATRGPAAQAAPRKSTAKKTTAKKATPRKSTAKKRTAKKSTAK